MVVGGERRGVAAFEGESRVAKNGIMGRRIMV